MFAQLRRKEVLATAFMALLFLGLATTLWAQETPAPAAPATTAVAETVTFTKEMAAAITDYKITVDTLWVMMAAFLVFFMNLGFGMVESGLCRAKNTVNILSKNFIVFAISSLAFYALGWGLMFGDGNSVVGLKGLWFVSGADNSPAVGDAYQGVYSAINWTGVPFWAKFFFQLVFAGTAATIVSGAVAERIKFHSFIIFTFIIAGVTLCLILIQRSFA